MAAETEEIETDVAELVCYLAEWMAQYSVLDNHGPSEADKQQFRDALNKLIDERVAAAMAKLTVTPPRWRKGQQVVRLRSGVWMNPAPADRNVFVVTQDSWGESPTWVEPRETAKV